jgi:hypothetical protein
VSDFLTSIGAIVNDAERSVSQAGAQLLHTAQRETQLFGSFVNGAITGPLAVKFGSNPVQFMNNVVRKDAAAWVKITNDVARRAGVAHYGVPDPKTGKIVQIPSTVKTSTPFNVLVLTVACAAFKSPAVFVDAAGRHASGTDGGRGIDDVHWWPMAAPRVDRGFFGVDDLAALAAIATIIATIAGVVLPILASAVGFVVKLVAPKPDVPPPAPKDAAGAIFGIPPILILVVAAAGLAIVFLWKPKAAAAAAGAA